MQALPHRERPANIVPRLIAIDHNLVKPVGRKHKKKAIKKATE